MKNIKLIILIIILPLVFNFKIIAQKGNFEMILKKDTVKIKALKQYLSYLQNDTSLEKGKYVVMFRENMNHNDDSLFTTNVILSATTVDYYKYDKVPLAGYFYLDDILFIVEVNSHFITGSTRGIVEEIDDVVGNSLEKYVEPNPVIVSETLIINGKPKLVKGKLVKDFDNRRFKHSMTIIFFGDSKHYKFYSGQ